MKGRKRVVLTVSVVFKTCRSFSLKRSTSHIPIFGKKTQGKVLEYYMISETRTFTLYLAIFHLAGFTVLTPEMKLVLRGQSQTISEKGKKKKSL